MPSKVLIVDDSKLSVMMLHDGLRQNGFEVVVASDGDEGLQLAKRESPDLILLDMHLPTMNGRQFLEKLRDFPVDPPIPVIVITASEPVDDLANGHDNVHACFNKPVPMAQLVAKIRECLGE